MRSRSLGVPLLLASAACRASPALAPAEPPAREVRVPPQADATVPAPPAPPSAQPAPDPAPDPAADDVWHPQLDCSTFRGGPEPSRRSLCEVAMGLRPAASLVDARGYAYVAYHDDPSGDGPGPKMVRERACGAEAVAGLAGLLKEIRGKLAIGGDDDPWISCKGLVCQVRAEGEWSTPQTLYFRAGPKGPVLEAWTRIEISLISPEEVAKRTAWIGAGRRALAAKACPR